MNSSYGSEVLKEGELEKQSRFMKEWRKYFIYFEYAKFHRRWFVLTPTHLLSFKDKNRSG